MHPALRTAPHMLRSKCMRTRLLCKGCWIGCTACTSTMRGRHPRCGWGWWLQGESAGGQAQWNVIGPVQSMEACLCGFYRCSNTIKQSKHRCSNTTFFTAKLFPHEFICKKIRCSPYEICIYANLASWVLEVKVQLLWVMYAQFGDATTRTCHSCLDSLHKCDTSTRTSGELFKTRLEQSFSSLGGVDDCPAITSMAVFSSAADLCNNGPQVMNFHKQTLDMNQFLHLWHELVYHTPSVWFNKTMSGSTSEDPLQIQHEWHTSFVPKTKHRQPNIPVAFSRFGNTRDDCFLLMYATFGF